MTMKERNRLMAKRYKAGFTLDQVGQEWGLTRERARQILAKLGVKSRPMGSWRRLPKEEWERRYRAIVALHREGWSAAQACRKAGFNPSDSTYMEMMRERGDYLGRTVIKFPVCGSPSKYAKGCRCRPCTDAAVKENEYYRRLRIYAGRCPGCGRAPDSDFSYCKLCRERQRVYESRSRSRRVKKGLCARCPEKREGSGSLCERCRVKRNKKALEGYYRRKESHATA